MILIDRPCCEAPMVIEMPIPDLIRCEDCATTWDVADDVPTEVRRAA